MFSKFILNNIFKYKMLKRLLNVRSIQLRKFNRSSIIKDNKSPILKNNSIKIIDRKRDNLYYETNKKLDRLAKTSVILTITLFISWSFIFVLLSYLYYLNENCLIIETRGILKEGNYLMIPEDKVNNIITTTIITSTILFFVGMFYINL